MFVVPIEAILYCNTRHILNAADFGQLFRPLELVIYNVISLQRSAADGAADVCFQLVLTSAPKHSTTAVATGPIIMVFCNGCIDGLPSRTIGCEL